MCILVLDDDDDDVTDVSATLVLSNGCSLFIVSSGEYFPPGIWTLLSEAMGTQFWRLELVNFSVTVIFWFTINIC